VRFARTAVPQFFRWLLPPPRNQPIAVRLQSSRGVPPAPLGSADLRVRPLGLNRKKLVPTGSQETWIGKEPSAGNTTQSTARLSNAPLSRPPAAGRSFASTRFDAQTKVHGSAKKPLWIHLAFRRPPTSSIPPNHVLKGHSFIAQGSCAALPWVTGQTDRISPERAGLTGAGRRNRRRNSIVFAGSGDRW
jgi:hypothetical protein